MLLENTYKVTKVNKKSASEAFKGLSVGDLVHFSIPIKSVGSGGRGTYAAYVNCKNLQTGGESKLSFNQIGRVLESFEWGEIDVMS